MDNAGGEWRGSGPASRLPASTYSSADFRGVMPQHTCSRELSRGQSDGVVLAREVNSISAQELSQRQETWQDFLRQTSDGDHEAIRRQIATRRAAMVMQDRRRRMQESRDDMGRRRATTTLSYATLPRTHGRPPTASTSSADGSVITPGSYAVSNVSERPLPQTLSHAHGGEARFGGYLRPRWQPDSEVSECPICGRSFAFWYRKHHCRKCGRVVCASCSPHRITIPRQFIVQPPIDLDGGFGRNGLETLGIAVDDDEEHSLVTDTLQSSARDQLDPALGGGQEVRLCNPCVPDSHPMPLQPYASPVSVGLALFPQAEQPPSIPYRSRGRSSAMTDDPYQLDNSGALSSSQPVLPSRERSRRNSARRNTGSTASWALCRPHSFTDAIRTAPWPVDLAVQSSTRSSAQQAIIPGQFDHRHAHRRLHASTSEIPDPLRYRSSLAGPEPHLPTPTFRTFPPPSLLQEDDECPICHLELPPKGHDDSETTREAHVAACIEAHFSAPLLHPSPAVSAAVGATSTTPAQGWSFAQGTVRENAEQDAVLAAEETRRRRRATGMVIYHASEKDCIGEDGVPQECIICFEEFEAGNEMGRLECLCKFHKVGTVLVT